MVCFVNVAQHYFVILRRYFVTSSKILKNLCNGMYVCVCICVCIYILCMSFLAMSENYGRNSIPKNYDIYICYMSLRLIYREALRNPAIKIYLRRVARTQKQVNCIRSQGGRLRILISQTRARGIKFVNADGTRWYRANYHANLRR